MKNIIIIDYKVGNIGSIGNAIQRIGYNYTLSNKEEEIISADKVILPGVGSASEAMKNLRESELDKILIKYCNTGKPLLGICLGMQLLFEHSDEGDTKCLSIIKGRVKKFKHSGNKVPQIGWNNVMYTNKYKSKLFLGIKNNSSFYYVNSYYCLPKFDKDITAITSYGIDFCSAIENGNIFGVQFHPEKSSTVGERLLTNFLLI